MWSQTPVIWQKITQMGQTEPAEPTGSWEWWCTGCFLSTGCTLAQKLHTLTHQTEPLKEGRQRDQRGQEIGEGAARSRRGMSIFRTEWRAEVENERRKRGEVVLKASQKKNHYAKRSMKRGELALWWLLKTYEAKWRRLGGLNVQEDKKKQYLDNKGHIFISLLRILRWSVEMEWLSLRGDCCWHFV